LRNDLAWCYRIVFGLTVLKFDEFFEWNPATQTRGHAFKLYKTRSPAIAEGPRDAGVPVEIW